MSERVHDRRKIPFFMVGKPDLQRLAKCGETRLLPYARSVYFALLELANDQRVDEVPASRADVALRAGVSVATLKRCVPLLVDAGLLTVREVAGHPNIWTLSDGEVGSDRAGGRFHESRGAGLTEPPLKETSQEGKKEEVKTLSESCALDQVWAHYQATMPNGSRCKLDAARRLVITTALKVRSVEECCRAIDGLARSEYHAGRYTDIKYALRGGGHSPSPDTTIDRMAALANGNGHRNGNGRPVGILEQQIWPDGRSWSELTPAEQAHAKDAMTMGLRPWEPRAPQLSQAQELARIGMTAEMLAEPLPDRITADNFAA